MTIQYAILESRPVLIGEIEAWWLVKGKWERLEHTIAFCEAYVLTKQAYERMFENLPPLPKRAFKMER